MDPEESQCLDRWKKSSSSQESLISTSDNKSFLDFNSSFHDYGMRIEQQLSNFIQPFGAENPVSRNMNNQKQTKETPDWDPRAMLDNLSFLEKKVRQLQELVHLIVNQRGQATAQPDEIFVQQQQLITADVTSIIVQLISTAGSLLPSAKHALNPEMTITKLGQAVLENAASRNNNSDIRGCVGAEQNCPNEDQEMKSDDDAEEGENLPPGSYEILQLEKDEILAPHTHFCTICGKGFKRDANLRMHMRGHGNEYKTAAALAKPHKETTSSDPVLVKRYSCPYLGCKRNKDHKKFQPLKTILCVKNHYKRTHCDKTYTCSRCNVKKFSVIADLKTHEKHCGRDRWICSCGTTFSRKDKLFGHIGLFQGHTPITLEESKGSDPGQCSEMAKKVEVAQNVMDAQGSREDPTCCLSPLGFETSDIDVFHEFPRPPYEDSDSFSFLISGLCDYPPQNGR